MYQLELSKKTFRFINSLKPKEKIRITQAFAKLCHHKDPFDRLLIVQTKRYAALFVSKDTTIKDYGIETFWL